MKKYILIPFISVLFASFLFAQTPQFINYQGMARNASGQPLSNKAINVRLSIITGSVSGITDYSELQPVTTNGLGLFNVAIGAGNPIIGSYSTVNWALAPKFIKSEIDPNGGTNFILVATSQFLAVPYALYALSATPPKQPTINVTASVGISDQFCRLSSSTSINANLTLIADQVVSTSAIALTTTNLGLGSILFSNIGSGIYTIGVSSGSFYNSFFSNPSQMDLNPNYTIVAGGKTSVDLGKVIQLAPFDFTTGITNLNVSHSTIHRIDVQYSNIPLGTTALRVGFVIYVSKNPDMSSSIRFQNYVNGITGNTPTGSVTFSSNPFQSIYNQLGLVSGNTVYYQAEVVSNPCNGYQGFIATGNGNKSNIVSYIIP